MRRVPVDEEFGPPIATLRNSPIALFENGTIAEINEPRDDHLLFNHYSFYFENVSQISHINCDNSNDQISPMITKLKNYKFKLSVTFLLFIILIISYYFSINYSQLPLIKSVSNSFAQIIISLLVIGLAVGFEHYIYDYFTKNTFKSRILQLHLVHRNQPKLISEEKSRIWNDFFEYHNGFTRIAIVLGCIFIPENKNFSDDIYYFIILLLFLNLLIYMFATLASPLIIYEYLSKRYSQKNFVKVPELDFGRFVEETESLILKNKKLSMDEIKSENKTLQQLLSQVESSGLEFKSSIWTPIDDNRWIPRDTKSWKPEAIKEMKDKLQDNIVKTVAGMLNKNGGVLLIGVKDNPFEHQTPTIGIDVDFHHLSSKHRNEEGYKNRVSELLDEAFGNKTTRHSHLHIDCEPYNEHLVCRIDVKPVDRVYGQQIWVKTKTLGDDAFFVRGLAGTDQLKGSDASDHIHHNFKEPRNLVDQIQ